MLLGAISKGGIGALCLLAVAACDRPEEKGKEVQLPAEMQKAMEPLPSNPTEALAALINRIDAHVTQKDGFIVLNDTLTGTFGETILPLSAPWSISCGIQGVAISFGPRLSAGGEDSIDTANVT